MNNIHGENERKNFVDFLIILLKRRKLIIWNVTIVTLAALIISFLILYNTSTANILPPKSQGGLISDIGGISSTIKDLSQSLGRLWAVSDEAYSIASKFIVKDGDVIVIPQELESVYVFGQEWVFLDTIHILKEKIIHII
ncbi:MAG: hypothetical protein PVH88_04485 [Ignavibacteria bacterium]|jgi:hypothetical protein